VSLENFHAPIAFHMPFVDAREAEAVRAVLATGRIGGGGPVLDRVEARLRERLSVKHAIVTTSCTHAVEMATLALGLGSGDEVIVPSYSYPGVASAIARTGAQLLFADSLADSPQLDPDDIARRITTRTRAVIVVDYGGVAADYDAISAVCEERGVALLEDAAQAFDARHRGRACGTLASTGFLSFHETKNVTCGEGGALLTDDDSMAAAARVAREAGTDRAAFRAGEVRRYAWQALGSTYLPSELAMAVLEVQLDKADEILRRRRRLFERYLEALSELAAAGRLTLPHVPADAEPNGHIFHVLTEDEQTRDALAGELRAREIQCATHFEPLDQSPFGRRVAGSEPPLPHCQGIARRILRLPLHALLRDEEQDRVIDCVRGFFRRR